MDHIITVSRTTRDFLSKRYRIPPDRFTICYNAVKPGFRVLEPHQITVREKYRTGDRFVFQICKFSERKNPWTTLHSFAEFSRREAGRGFFLVLAGSGWDNPRVRRFIRDHNLDRRVILPGFIPEQEAVQFLNAASVFLFPSYVEEFGMPNVEAMACGCPVLTSRVFAIPEILGDAAVIANDPKDWLDLAGKITAIVTDGRLRRRLVEHGLSRARQFSWEENARKMLAVYRDLMGMSPTAS